MKRVNDHVTQSKYRTVEPELNPFETHPNERLRKHKDFSHTRSRPSSSNGRRPTACAVREDCEEEEELRHLLRLLASR